MQVFLNSSRHRLLPPLLLPRRRHRGVAGRSLAIASCGGASFVHSPPVTAWACALGWRVPWPPGATVALLMAVVRRTVGWCSAPARGSPSAGCRIEW
jgi:hypothetical protein